MDETELLLHPVRIRIVQAISGGARTEADLRARLADLAAEALAAELARLVDAGVVEHAEPGGVFGLRDQRGVLDTSRLDRSAAEKRANLTAALGVFTGELHGYLDQADHGQPDGLTLVQRPVWLTPAELAELSTAIARIIAPKLGNEPAGRKRHFLSVAVLPHDPG